MGKWTPGPWEMSAIVVRRHTMERLGSLVSAAFGQRLTYKALIA